MSYQDPLLRPGYLKNVIKNLPGKVKNDHTGYTYEFDSDTFEDEINDFFTYSETTVQLQEYQTLYQNTFSVNNNESNKKYKVQHILTLLHDLNCNTESSLYSCKFLLHVILGCFPLDKNESKQERINHLLENNEVFIQCGALKILFLKLQQFCDKLLEDSSAKQVDTCIQIDLCISILYVSLEFQRSKSKSEDFRKEFAILEPNMSEYLLSLVSKLQDKPSFELFPIRKAILLLWKSLLFISGGQEGIKNLAKKKKEEFALVSKGKDICMAKSAPQDAFHFQNETACKYPGYKAFIHPFQVSPNTAMNESENLFRAMGYSKAMKTVDLSLKISTKSSNSLTNLQQASQPKELIQEDPIMVLPLSDSGPSVPKSIIEAGELYKSNMYCSLANCQIIEVKLYNIRVWNEQKEKTIGDTFDAINRITRSNYGETSNDASDTFERLYAKTIPYFQNIVNVLLKLLMKSANILETSRETGNEQVATSFVRGSVMKNTDVKIIEEVDFIRDQEVYAKSISGILLILLKWTKSSHILKFEYLSELLIDSGCVLLLLKTIGSENMLDLVKRHTDIPYYHVFRPEECSIVKGDISSFSPPSDGYKVYSNRRNMYWTINCLRIIQMLTKNKPYRIKLLFEYKASLTLKRLLRITHPILKLYTLKLLKSQIPYLGKKWRSRNMSIVSGIYLNCTSTLRDDWISELYIGSDEEEERIEECGIRLLARVYNGRNYLSPLLPSNDKVGCYTDVLNLAEYGFEQDGLGTLSGDDGISLGREFVENYETWLEEEEHSYEEDDVVSSLCQMDAPAPMTPYPEYSDISNNPSILLSHKQLTYEIHKLYNEQLNAEFNLSPPLNKVTTKDVSNGTEWKKSPSTKNLTPLARYTGDERDLTYLNRKRNSNKCNSVQEIQNNFMQIEDQLLQKLMQVEDNTLEALLSRK